MHPHDHDVDKVIIGSRQSGKTYQSVKWLLEHPGAVLLVPSEPTRRYALDLAQRLSGLSRTHMEQDIMTVGGAERSMRGRRPAGVGIDGLDLLLPHWVNRYPLDLVTINSRAENVLFAIHEDEDDGWPARTRLWS